MKKFVSQDSIELQDVGFGYKDHFLFKNLNFSFTTNQFVGIIGLNGCGKSTFLKLIMGLLRPQQGHIRIFNREAGDELLKHYIGSSLQEIDFPSSIRVDEILSFVAKQYRETLDIKKLSQDFFIDDFSKKMCSELSGGMKRRLALACAFIGKPKVVLLDEPTTGLDQTSRKQLIHNLKLYQQKHQALVLMISHHPQEITDMVDQFFHIKEGQIFKLSPDKIDQTSKLKQVRFQCEQDIDFSFAEKVTVNNGLYQIISKDSDKVVKTLNQHTHQFKNLEIEKLKTEEMIRGFL